MNPKKYFSMENFTNNDRLFDSMHRYYVQFDDNGDAVALIRMVAQPHSAAQSSQVLIERCSLHHSHDILSLQGQWEPLSLAAGAIELRKLQEGDTGQVMLLPINNVWCLVNIANRMGQRNLMPIAFKIDSSSNGEILLTALPPDRSRNAFLKSLSLSPQNLPDLTSEMQDSLKKLLSDLEPSSKNETVSMEQAQEGFFSKITVGSEPPSHPLEPFELFLWKDQGTWKGSYRFFETQKTQSLIVSSESGQNWSPADLEAFEQWAGNPDRQNKDFLTHWNLKWIRTLLKVTPQQFHAIESLGHLYWPFQHHQLSSDRQYLVGKRILEGSAEFRAVDDEDPNLCHEMNSLSNDFRSILLIEPMAQFFENQQLMRTVEIQSIIDYYEALIAARMRMYDPISPISRVSKARYHLTLQNYQAAQRLENQPAQSWSDEEQLFLEIAYLYDRKTRLRSQETISLPHSHEMLNRILIVIQNILEHPAMMSDLTSQLTAILRDDTDSTNHQEILTREFYLKIANVIIFSGYLKNDEKSKAIIDFFFKNIGYSLQPHDVHDADLFKKMLQTLVIEHEYQIHPTPLTLEQRIEQIHIAAQILEKSPFHSVIVQQIHDVWNLTESHSMMLSFDFSEKSLIDFIFRRLMRNLSYRIDSQIAKKFILEKWMHFSNERKKLMILLMSHESITRNRQYNPEFENLCLRSNHEQIQSALNLLVSKDFFEFCESLNIHFYSAVFILAQQWPLHELMSHFESLTDSVESIYSPVIGVLLHRLREPERKEDLDQVIAKLSALLISQTSFLTFIDQFESPILAQVRSDQYIMNAIYLKFQDRIPEYVESISDWKKMCIFKNYFDRDLILNTASRLVKNLTHSIEIEPFLHAFPQEYRDVLIENYRKDFAKIILKTAAETELLKFSEILGKKPAQSFESLKNAFRDLFSDPTENSIEILDLLLKFSKENIQQLYHEFSDKIRELLETNPEHSVRKIISICIKSESVEIQNEVYSIVKDHAINQLINSARNLNSDTISDMQRICEAFPSKNHELLEIIQDDVIGSLKRQPDNPYLLRNVFNSFKRTDQYQFYMTFESDIMQNINDAPTLLLWIQVFHPHQLENFSQKILTLERFFSNEKNLFLSIKSQPSQYDACLARLENYAKILEKIPSLEFRTQFFEKLMQHSLISDCFDLFSETNLFKKMNIYDQEIAIKSFISAFQILSPQEKSRMKEKFFESMRYLLKIHTVIENKLLLINIYPDFRGHFEDEEEIGAIIWSMDRALANRIKEVLSLNRPQFIVRNFQNMSKNLQEYFLKMMVQTSSVRDCNRAGQMSLLLPSLSSEQRMIFLNSISDSDIFVDIMIKQPQHSMQDFYESIEDWSEPEKELCHQFMQDYLKSVLQRAQVHLQEGYSVFDKLKKDTVVSQMNSEELAEFYLNHEQIVNSYFRNASDVLKMQTLCSPHPIVSEILFKKIQEEISKEYGFSMRSHDILFLSECFCYFTENPQQKYFIDRFYKEIEGQLVSAFDSRNLFILSKFYEYAPSDERLAVVGKNILDWAMDQCLNSGGKEADLFIFIVQKQQWVAQLPAKDRLNIVTALLKTNRQELIEKMVDVNFPMESTSMYARFPFMIDVLRLGTTQTIRDLLKKGLVFEDALKMVNERNIVIRPEITAILEEYVTEKRRSSQPDTSRIQTLTSDQTHRTSHKNIFDDENGDRPPHCNIM